MQGSHQGLQASRTSVGNQLNRCRQVEWKAPGGREGFPRVPKECRQPTNRQAMEGSSRQAKQARPRRSQQVAKLLVVSENMAMR